MKEIILKYQPSVSKFILDYLSKKETSNNQNIWVKDVSNRLKNFVVQGKMARPALLCFSYEMFGSAIDQEIIKAAAAIQIIHSGLLIHDDIIDRDPKRYGQPTIFTQYIDLASDQKLNDSQHFGESMAICTGIMAYFMAAELLAEIKTEPGALSRLISFYSREIQMVGAGEMQDVYLAYVADKSLSEKDILPVLRDKTARYTLSIPLCAGAILAKQDEETVNTLYKIGENIGIIFQIRDDELGVFGDTETTGKPVGADIREGKKTLLYLYLFDSASKSDETQLRQLFGKQDITDEEIEFVRRKINDYGVPEKIQEKITNLKNETLPLINKLNIPEESKKNLIGILDFCATRQK